MFHLQIIDFLQSQTGLVTQRARNDLDKLQGLISLIVDPANHAQEDHSNYRNLMKLRNFVTSLGGEYPDLVYELKFSPGTYGTTVIKIESGDRTPLSLLECQSHTFSSTFLPQYGGQSIVGPASPDSIKEMLNFINNQCVGPVVHQCHLIRDKSHFSITYGDYGFGVSDAGKIDAMVFNDNVPMTSERLAKYFGDNLSGILIQDLLQVERNILTGLINYEVGKNKP